MNLLYKKTWLLSHFLHQTFSSVSLMIVMKKSCDTSKIHTHDKKYICPVLYSYKMIKWALIQSLWTTYKSKTNMLLFTDLIKCFFLPANTAGQKRSYINNFILSVWLKLEDFQTLKIWWTWLGTVLDSNRHPPDQLSDEVSPPN